MEVLSWRIARLNKPYVLNVAFIVQTLYLYKFMQLLWTSAKTQVYFGSFRFNQEEIMQNTIPLNWPFKTYNGQKVPKYKPVYPDAPFLTFINFTGE